LYSTLLLSTPTSIRQTHSCLTAFPSSPILHIAPTPPKFNAIHLKTTENPTPEAVAEFLAKYIKEKKITKLVAPHSSEAKNLMPRVAALVDAAYIPDVIYIDGDVYSRPIYAGKAQLLEMVN